MDALTSEAGPKAGADKAQCPRCKKQSEKVAILREHIQTLQDEIETLLSILQTMKRGHNHNFHDMAVKAAITGYDDFVETYKDVKADIDQDLEDVDAEEEEEEQGFITGENERASSEENPVESGEINSQRRLRVLFAHSFILKLLLATTLINIRTTKGKVSILAKWLNKVVTAVSTEWKKLLPKGKSDGHDEHSDGVGPGAILVQS